MKSISANFMSPPLSERKNFQNETQIDNVQIKKPVKRKARNNQVNQSHLDKENIILNPEEIPVKRTRRAKAMIDYSISEPVFVNEIADLVKRRTRGKKEQ